jgi:hypothetical protein
VPETPRGRNLIIHQNGTHNVDILRVVEIEEPEPPDPQPAPNGPQV